MGEKKKKKSKKEIEAERLAAEDARRQAEEALRLEELRRQKEREEKEKKERDAQEVLLSQEIANFQKQLDELAIIQNLNNAHVRLKDQKLIEEQDWFNFINCSNIPNPRIERDTTTYLSVWNGYRVVEAEPTLNELKKALSEAEELTSAIITQYCVSLSNGDHNTVQRLVAQLRMLRSMVLSKWDAVTLNILQNTDYFPREPNENFQYFADMYPHYLYGVWGNLIKNSRHKSVCFSDNPHFSLQLPRPIALANVGIRMLYYTGVAEGLVFCHTPTIDRLSRSDENNSKKCSMSVIGGVLYFDLVELPEPPKVVEFWTLRPVFPSTGNLRRLPYPFSRLVSDKGKPLPTDTTTDSNLTRSDPVSQKDFTAETDLSTSTPNSNGSKPAASQNSGMRSGEVSVGMPQIDETSMLTVTYPLRSGMFLTPEANVMYWDETEKGWKGDGIVSVELGGDRGYVRFKTIHFKPTAIVQPATSQFPYKFWSLQPLSANSCRLKIKGRYHEIELDIDESGVQLKKPLLPELNHTNAHEKGIERFGAGKREGIQFLLMKLAQLGLNFMALSGDDLGDDGIAKGLRPKKQATLSALSDGISLCCSAFAFKKSDCNLKAGPSACAVEVKKVVEFAPLVDLVDDVSDKRAEEISNEEKLKVLEINKDAISPPPVLQHTSGSPRSASSQVSPGASVANVIPPKSDFFTTVYDSEFMSNARDEKERTMENGDLGKQVAFVGEVWDVIRPKREVEFKIKEGTMPKSTVYHLLLDIIQSSSDAAEVKELLNKRVTASSSLYIRTVRQVLMQTGVLEWS
ncbi:hypothetical protein BKA69DRAFT_1089659 [Paraphysoderma sedebokerense]|nr:hypothetical protein BKA69DRAFT_1089659 [Paraphysoderma sedebokerense]